MPKDARCTGTTRSTAAWCSARAPAFLLEAPGRPWHPEGEVAPGQARGREARERSEAGHLQRQAAVHLHSRPAGEGNGRRLQGRLRGPEVHLACSPSNGDQGLVGNADPDHAVPVLIQIEAQRSSATYRSRRRPAAPALPATAGPYFHERSKPRPARRSGSVLRPSANPYSGRQNRMCGSGAGTSVPSVGRAYAHIDRDTRSRKAPGMTMSSPGPPSSTSVPSPPIKTSSPSPPRITSSPSPPRSTSSPGPPSS